jgi:hypothetical protein
MKIHAGKLYRIRNHNIDGHNGLIVMAVPCLVKRVPNHEFDLKSEYFNFFFEANGSHCFEACNATPLTEIECIFYEPPSGTNNAIG